MVLRFSHGYCIALNMMLYLPFGGVDVSTAWILIQNPYGGRGPRQRREEAGEWRHLSSTAQPRMGPQGYL